MRDYTDHQDSTRISPDELKEAEIDDSVHAVTKLKKKSFMPKFFSTAAFCKLKPRTEVCQFLWLLEFSAFDNFLVEFRQMMGCCFI
jgi:hypothetical protein